MTTVRLAVVETNVSVAAPFWRTLGYLPDEDSVPYQGDSVTTTAQVFNGSLAR